MVKFQFLLFFLFLAISAQGRIVTTNKPFDFMLVGKGYFGIIEENGSISYTRDGSFLANSEGYIVDTYGRKVLPGFKLPSNTNSLNVSNDGIVEAYLENNEIRRLGKISLYVKDGTSSYLEVDALQAPYNLELRQGMQYIKD